MAGNFEVNISGFLALSLVFDSKCLDVEPSPDTRQWYYIMAPPETFTTERCLYRNKITDEFGPVGRMTTPWGNQRTGT